MKKPTILFLILACLCGTAFANESKSVTLTRQEASNLHGALSAVQSGLSPLDTMAAADDINVLLPIATALQKGQFAAQRLSMQVDLPDGPQKAAKQIAIMSAIESKGDEPVTLDLQVIDVTSEEIKEGKITSATLSILRRFLAPVPPKK